MAGGIAVWVTGGEGSVVTIASVLEMHIILMLDTVFILTGTCVNNGIHCISKDSGHPQWLLVVLVNGWAHV